MKSVIHWISTFAPPKSFSSRGSAYKSIRVQANGLAPQSPFELFPIEIRFKSALLYNIRNICLYKLEILVVLCMYAVGGLPTLIRSIFLSSTSVSFAPRELFPPNPA